MTTSKTILQIAQDWISDEKNLIECRMSNLREQMDLAANLEELEMLHDLHSENLQMYSSILDLENKMDRLAFNIKLTEKAQAAYEKRSNELIVPREVIK